MQVSELSSFEFAENDIDLHPNICYYPHTISSWRTDLREIGDHPSPMIQEAFKGRPWGWRWGAYLTVVALHMVVSVHGHNTDGLI